MITVIGTKNYWLHSSGAALSVVASLAQRDGSTWIMTTDGWLYVDSCASDAIEHWLAGWIQNG